VAPHDVAGAPFGRTARLGGQPDESWRSTTGRVTRYSTMTTSATPTASSEGETKSFRVSGSEMLVKPAMRSSIAPSTSGQAGSGWCRTRPEISAATKAVPTATTTPTKRARRRIGPSPGRWPPEARPLDEEQRQGDAGDQEAGEGCGVDDVQHQGDRQEDDRGDPRTALPRRIPRESIMSATPASATRAPAAWATPSGR